MEKMTSGIYQIKNKITNDFYIGQSVNLRKRRDVHIHRLRNNKYGNTHFQNAFNKYGESNFEFNVLLYCEPFELTRYEQSLVDKLKPVYNLCKECVDSRKGVPMSDKTKTSILKSITGHVATTKTRERMSISQTGHVVTDEMRHKISVGNSGKFVSKETRDKLSEAAKKQWARVRGEI